MITFFRVVYCNRPQKTSQRVKNNSHSTSSRVVLFCSLHAMTSSVFYYSTHTRKNVIYLLNRTLHGSSKKWILCSRGKNNISFVGCAYYWDIFFLRLEHKMQYYIPFHARRRLQCNFCYTYAFFNDISATWGQILLRVCLKFLINK